MTERHVALDGCLNLRDLGGYLTTDGREVRWGCLYRSGELCSLTDSDLGALSRLGIRVVIDLRNERERSSRPSRLPPGVELIERSSPSSNGPERTLEDQIAAGEILAKDDEYVTSMYIRLLDGLIPQIRLILERAAVAADRPMLFHCAAGKDRTGIVAAVLLGVLGVPDQAIIEDYELTTTHYAAPRLDALAGLLADHDTSAARVLHLLEARTPALQGALRHLHERWGNYEGYATRAVGVSTDLIDRLRNAVTSGNA